MKKSIDNIDISDARYIYKWLLGNCENEIDCDIKMKVRSYLRTKKESVLDCIVRIDKMKSSMPASNKKF